MSKASEDAALFRTEEAVVAAGEARLAAGGPIEPADFEDLLRNYEKLFRTTLRLVRHADRNEGEFNRLAVRLKETNSALEEKNQALQSLSAKLSRYLSPQLYDSIFSGAQSATLAAARKQLTVFFADIVDFTSLAETMEPEELTRLLNGYLTEMAQIAHRHGGTIDKYIGDAIMIFFGDSGSEGPADDARRAVAMALAMQARLAEIRAEHDGRGQTYPIRVRMGMTTGFCTIGNFGSEDRLDYTICGTPVNLAHRLQEHAAPDEILISETTYGLLDDPSAAVPAGTIRVKGISRPFKAFGIIAEPDDARYVQVRDDGFQVLVDFDRIDDRAAADALEAIDGIASRLRERAARKNEPPA
jgi:adenylate cyclase